MDAPVDRVDPAKERSLEEGGYFLWTPLLDRLEQTHEIVWIEGLRALRDRDY